MPIHSGALANEAREIVVPVLVSFETGEQVTGLRLYPPPSGDWRLVAVRYEVVKALGATDAGTIDIKDDAGSAAVTQLSLPASSALGVRGSFTVSSVLRRVLARLSGGNAYHALTTAKTTAGGKVQLWLYYRRVRPGADA